MTLPTLRPLMLATLFSVFFTAALIPSASAASAATNLTIVWFDWVPCHALSSIARDWPGGNVTVVCVPLVDWHSTIFKSFRSESPQYDLVVLDSQWLGQAVASSYLVNLTDLINLPSTRKDDFIDAALSAYGMYPPHSRQYWGLPLLGDVQFILYRKSIFQSLGLIPPSTLEELLALGELIAAKQAMKYAFSTFWCGNENDAICYDETPSIWSQFAWMFGGDIWDDNTYQIKDILDSNENIEATDYLRKLFNLTSRNTDISYAGAMSEFCNNQSAMLMVWFGFIGTLDAFVANCPIADDVGFFAIPASGKTGLHILQLGGMGVHVNAFSDHIAEAKDLAVFLTNRSAQKKYSLLGGYSVRKSVLAEPDFLFSNTGQCVSYRYIFLQSFPLVRDMWNIPEYLDLLRIQRVWISRALTSNVTSFEALTSIANEQQAIITKNYPCGGQGCDRKDSSSGLSLTAILAIGFALGISCILLVATLIVYFVKKRDEFPFPKADQWSVPPSCITTIRRLGAGAFGVVFLARYERETSTTCINKLVACKFIRENPTRAERRMFVQEASTFKQACAESHPNIVQLIGTCLQGDPMTIIMEYMGNGDVKTWLIQQRENSVVPPTDLLMRMARDAAAGMAHLARRGLVHCDLAARNCMLDDDLVLKITDWGQAHSVTYQHLGNVSRDRLMPVRWMAPEALLESEFTTATDVWSYGVLLWEIFSCGAIPYDIMTNKEVFDEIIKGYRLTQPARCPDDIYQVMLACWNPNRPSFEVIHAHLSALLDPNAPHPESLLVRQGSVLAGTRLPSPFHVSSVYVDLNNQSRATGGGDDEHAAAAGGNDTHVVDCDAVIPRSHRDSASSLHAFAAVPNPRFSQSGSTPPTSHVGSAIQLNVHAPSPQPSTAAPVFQPPHWTALDGVVGLSMTESDI